MKIKFTLLLSAAAITFNGLAQPIITGIGTTPYGAKSFGYVIPGPITEGTPGANQTWDYSTVPHDTSTYYIKNVDFSTLSPSIQAAYPTANMASEMYFGGSLAVTVIFKSEANDLLYVGMNSTPFPSPDTQLVYPHSYLETKAGFTYDAYGTLMTPFGTYTNVVRLREVTGADYKYDYWQFTPQYRLLMEYKVNMSTSAISGQTFFDAQLPTGIAETKVDEDVMSIYPNPSTGLFHLNANSMKINSVNVYNLIGEVVLQQGAITEIDLSHVPKGIYFVQVNTGTKNYTKKITLQ